MSNLYVSVRAPWQLVDFSEDFSTKPVGSKDLALQFGPCDVYVDGTTNLASSTIRANGFKLMPLTAKVTPQQEAASNLDIAKVVFTIGWATYCNSKPLYMWTLGDTGAKCVCFDPTVESVEVSGYKAGLCVFNWGVHGLQDVASAMCNEGDLPATLTTDAYKGVSVLRFGTGKFNDLQWVQFQVEEQTLRCTFNKYGTFAVEYNDGKPFCLSSKTRHMLGYTTDQESVVIPERFTYNGTRYVVTDIVWDAFAGCTALKHVTLPCSASYIEMTTSWDPETHSRKGLFSDCANLTSIRLSDRIYNSVTEFREKVEADIPVTCYDYRNDTWLSFGGGRVPDIYDPGDVDWGSMTGP